MREDWLPAYCTLVPKCASSSLAEINPHSCRFLDNSFRRFVVGGCGLAFASFSVLTNVALCATMQHMEDKPISIRLDGKLRKALQELADKDMRKLSDYIRLVLFRHVQDLHQASGKVFHDHTPVSRKGGK